MLLKRWKVDSSKLSSFKNHTLLYIHLQVFVRDYQEAGENVETLFWRGSEGATNIIKWNTTFLLVELELGASLQTFLALSHVGHFMNEKNVNWSMIIAVNTKQPRKKGSSPRNGHLNWTGHGWILLRPKSFSKAHKWYKPVWWCVGRICG